MKTKTVSTETGDFVLRTPTAGQRNDALLKSEVKGKISEMKFMVELLKLCIVSHPFKINNIQHGLDALPFQEYDQLLLGLGELMAPAEDTKKKLESVSESTATPTAGQ